MFGAGSTSHEEIDMAWGLFLIRQQHCVKSPNPMDSFKIEPVFKQVCLSLTLLIGFLPLPASWCVIRTSPRACCGRWGRVSSFGQSVVNGRRVHDSQPQAFGCKCKTLQSALFPDTTTGNVQDAKSCASLGPRVSIEGGASPAASAGTQWMRNQLVLFQATELCAWLSWQHHPAYPTDTARGCPIYLRGKKKEKCVWTIPRVQRPRRGAAVLGCLRGDTVAGCF